MRVALLPRASSDLPANAMPPSSKDDEPPDPATTDLETYMPPLNNWLSSAQAHEGAAYMGRDRSVFTGLNPPFQVALHLPS